MDTLTRRNKWQRISRFTGKKVTQLQPISKSVPPHSKKNFVQRKIVEDYTTNLINKQNEKLWEKIEDSWNVFSIKPRKEAVANFRLKTGHDCLAELLHRIGILPTNECPICNASVMNSEHLLTCSGLDTDSRRQGNICKLYWDPRFHMTNL